MDIRAATALAGQVENVAEFCRRHQISRVTFYKWRRRFAAQGWDGLAKEQSRRPVSCPSATGADVVAAVVKCRVEMLAAGSITARSRSCGPCSATGWPGCPRGPRWPAS